MIQFGFLKAENIAHLLAHPFHDVQRMLQVQIAVSINIMAKKCYISYLTGLATVAHPPPIASNGNVNPCRFPSFEKWMSSLQITLDSRREIANWRSYLRLKIYWHVNCSQMSAIVAPD